MDSTTCKLLEPLAPSPVQDVSLANVSCLRLDRFDALAPGNKHFKMRIYFEEAQARGIKTLVSFGGPWSNHLHALAARGAALGLNTVGIVRGEQAGTAMLEEAENWGMKVCRVSYSEYRRRYDAAYIAATERRFAPCLVIPEGGADARGARGAMDIARLLPLASRSRRLVLGVGSGATLAGLAAAIDTRTMVTGISALTARARLESRIAALLASLEPPRPAGWELLYDYHCGGFARVTPELERFQSDFESVQGIPLEPVYTAKVFFAVHDLLRRGTWKADEDIVVVHTGGLQGRRGFSQPETPASDPVR